MPAKSEKQKKFFGAVMGAKEGQKGVTGAAKKAAKEMPKKEIKKFLKKEGFDALVDSFLSKYYQLDEVTEKHCDYAADGCDCDGCAECKENQEKA
jgi:hypothetical protein